MFTSGNALYAKLKTQIDISPQEENHHRQQIETIKLDKGKKWTVDANMMVYIHTMEKDIAGFEKSGVTDYKFLAEKLKQNIGLLTSNCTMKGKAHDELHKWLLPYIDLVNEFAKSKNQAEAEKLFQSLQYSMKQFNQYFQ